MTNLIQDEVVAYPWYTSLWAPLPSLITLPERFTIIGSHLLWGIWVGDINTPFTEKFHVE
jgi:hypothetical protein